jgi:hypothetical protein
MSTSGTAPAKTRGTSIGEADHAEARAGYSRHASDYPVHAHASRVARSLEMVEERGVFEQTELDFGGGVEHVVRGLAGHPHLQQRLVVRAELRERAKDRGDDSEAK